MSRAETIFLWSMIAVCAVLCPGCVIGLIYSITTHDVTGIVTWALNALTFAINGFVFWQSREAW
jgi:hypothetical protein